MVNSPSDRNEYQWYLMGEVGGKGGRCVRLTTSPYSRAYCIEILGALTSWSPKGLSRPLPNLRAPHCISLAFGMYPVQIPNRSHKPVLKYNSMIHHK